MNIETRLRRVPGTGAFIRLYRFPDGSCAVDSADWDALSERERSGLAATGFQVVGEQRTVKVTQADSWPADTWQGELEPAAPALERQSGCQECRRDGSPGEVTSDGDQEQPRCSWHGEVCNHCYEPIRYDPRTGTYHHRSAQARPCFLIPEAAGS